MATLDEAKRCPDCKRDGVLQRTEQQPDGNSMHVYVCMYERCEGYRLIWNVTVFSDGTVPDPTNFANMPKAIKYSHNSELEQLIRDARASAEQAEKAALNRYEIGRDR